MEISTPMFRNLGALLSIAPCAAEKSTEHHLHSRKQPPSNHLWSARNPPSSMRNNAQRTTSTSHVNAVAPKRSTCATHHHQSSSSSWQSVRTATCRPTTRLSPPCRFSSSPNNTFILLCSGTGSVVALPPNSHHTATVFFPSVRVQLPSQVPPFRHSSASAQQLPHRTTAACAGSFSFGVDFILCFGAEKHLCVLFSFIMTHKIMVKSAPEKVTLTLAKAKNSNATPSSQERSSTAGQSKGKHPRSPLSEENPCGIEFKNEEQSLSNAHIRKSEMLLLWEMESAIDLDLGSWLGRQFTKVGKAVSGQIAIGGLITPIARHFNILLDGDRTILVTSRIDLEMLVNNEMLVKRDDHYCLVMSENLNMSPQSLPNPEFTMHSSGFSSIPIGPHASDFSQLHESIVALQG
ncbi:hypothetical protein SESBI_42750 [Sesbania bispinosa]|nr:hypothetical protein SESBI_42750 [Sesbania bispinosa]